MKKVNQYKYILILFISLFILIPQIKAKTITTTYNNYYFFLESYKKNELNNIEETINYTAFPPVNKFGIDEFIEAEEVTLVRTKEDCKKLESECWTYYDYYEKYNEIEKKGNSISYIINYTKHNSKVLTDGNYSYYTHGSYSSDSGKTWQNSSDSTLFEKFNLESDDEYININLWSLSCASIKTNGNLLSTATGTEAEEDHNYFYVIITRNLNNFNNNYTVDENSINRNENISNCPYDKIYPISDEILSPVLYKYTYTTTSEVCEPNVPKPNTGKCNSSDNELTSTCQKETIETSNSRADVKIDQNGTVSNILTPDSVYQGGGFKFGFVYYNEISWDFAEDENIYTTLGSTDAAKEEITAAMKKKLLNINTFQENIVLDNISFGNENIDSSLIQKNCKRSGEFNSGETVTTICTFYLPNSIIEPYTGKITYSTAIGTNYGINNKYYTPLTYEGKYNIKATLKNLDTLIDDEKWTGDWSLTFDGSKDDSCQIDVVKRLYETTYDSKYSYAFLYRPIDLNNPFPNRNAGVNWYNWIQNINNQERLKETYTKLQYQVKLDNKKTYAIKDYNSKNDYLNWDSIDESEESSFIDEYFDIYRKNIEGDNP